MSAVRGVLVGSFGLVTLYNIASAPQHGTTKGVMDLAALPARFAHWLVSPDVPLIPNRGGVDSSGNGLSGTWINPTAAAAAAPGVPE